MNKNSLYDTEYYEKIKQEENYKKERKQRVFLLAGIVVMLLAIYLVSPLSRIDTIIINGNEKYSEKQIKEIAKVDLDQLNFLKPAFLIENNLSDSKLFEKVTVLKSISGKVEINVKENKLLYFTTENKKNVFYDQAGNKLSFDAAVELMNTGMVPELIPNKGLDDEIKEKLVDRLSQLDNSVLNEISQIKYTPQQYDKEFFTFIMTGKKKIYIETNLDNIVKVGSRYHSFSINTTYKCSVIQFIDSENKAIVKKCD